MEEFIKELERLKPYQINPENCFPAKSFYEQIKNSMHLKQRYTDKQDKQFCLGNGFNNNDPLETAKYLLEREYGDSYLFYPSSSSLFIPPCFISKLLSKKSAVRNFNIKLDIRSKAKFESKFNPTNWFTKQLQLLSCNLDEFTKTLFDSWRMKTFILHLIFEYGPSGFDRVSIPTKHKPLDILKCSLSDFHDFCLDCLNHMSGGSNHFITNELKSITHMIPNMHKLNKWMNKKLKKYPFKYSTLNWMKDLEVSDISGEESEYYFYEELLKVVECSEENFTVLHSLDFYTSERNNQEVDFLIFSSERKIIMAIEVKTSFTVNAFKQLERYRKIIEENFGDQLDNQWIFMPVLFIYDASTLPTEKCQSKFLITSKTDIIKWFEDLLKPFSLTRGDKNSVEHLKNVLKILVFTLHISRAVLPSGTADIKLVSPITTSKYSRYMEGVIEAISNTTNILFYCDNQIEMFLNNSSNHSKIILNGLYSTGKTIMLREKAEILAKEGKKVLFIVGTYCKSKPLLQMTLEERWVELSLDGNITTICMSQFQVDPRCVCKSLFTFITTNQFEYVLIDEWQLDVLCDDMDYFERNCKLNITLWIAFSKSVYNNCCRKNERFKIICRDNMLYQDFKKNMRNQKKIANFTLQSHHIIPSHHIITISSVTNYFNINNTYIFHHHKFRQWEMPSGRKPLLIDDREKTGSQKINEALTHMEKCTKDGVLFIIRVENDINITKELINKINHCHQNVKFYLSHANLELLKTTIEPLDDLKRSKVLLVTDVDSIEGFEWPNVIVYLGEKDFCLPSHYQVDSTNLFVRATVNLVVISHKE